MEGGQFFFEVTKEEEVAWSKVWARDWMGQTVGSIFKVHWLLLL
jgi:hypothetical protein